MKKGVKSMVFKGLNEDKITRALYKNTEVPSGAKDEVWDRIEEEIFTPFQEKERKISMRKNKRWIKYAASAAAVALIVVSAQTDSAHALINQIKEIFAPEKELDQAIEGIEEENTLHLTESSTAEYVIYVDEERYKLISQEEKDLIVPREPLGEAYPEVSMEIKHKSEVLPEAHLSQVENDLKSEFPNLSSPRKVNQPVSGWELYGVAGDQWDSPFIKVYLIEDGQDGSFMITQRYFLEAEEGHGARFDAMLKEFHILDENNN